MILIFGTRVLNDDVLRDFSFFQNFDFSGCQGGGGKRAKIGSN